MDEIRIMENHINQLSYVEAEKSVLGTLIMYNDIYYGNADSLFTELFTTYENQLIFTAMKEVADSGSPIDLITLTNQCFTKGYFKMMKEMDSKSMGPGVISNLTNTVSHHNFNEHLNVLIEYYQLRRLKNIAAEVSQKSQTREHSKEIISFINTEIVELVNINDDEFDKLETIADAVKSMEPGSIENVVRTGIENLDEFIFGFELCDLIIVAGTTSMGKTAFALRLFRNFMQSGYFPAFFSLEMSKEQLVSRLLAMESDVALSDIRKKQLNDQSWVNMNNGVAALEKLDFIIDDKTSNLNQIANKIRKYHIKHGTKVFFIDYLQLVKANLSNKKATREQEVATISRTIKELCRDLKVVVVALSQLSRKVSERADKRPQLSDLRESGAIEQDADMVLFPFRQAYYDAFETLPYKEKATLIIAKGRGTGLSDIELFFISSRTNYLNSETNRVSFNDNLKPDYDAF